MNKSILNQILHEYEIKRNKAIESAQNNKISLINSNPNLIKIEDEISKNSLEISKKILFADEKCKKDLLVELKKKNDKLIKEKNALIKNITKSSSYLSPKFECKKCNDTGYIKKDGKTEYCSCLLQKIYDISYNKSNIGNLENENFSKFNSKIFSNEKNKDKYNSTLSPRENIDVIREKCLSFIENFENPDEKNLVFTGNTGTGKTFLINCIANELLKTGKTILYQTSPIMFDSILEEKFDKENSNLNIFNNLLTVDLLIIDDLGTENISDSKLADLFTILNTRLLNQNRKITKTIISTNLNIDELFKNYTNRIGSRLAGNYKFLRFYGDDLRIKKNQN